MNESTTADEIGSHRDELLDAIEEQVKEISTALATITGSQTKTYTYEVPTGSYTLKLSGTDVIWFRFEPGTDDPIYLISNSGDPEQDPTRLATSVDSYPAFLGQVESQLTDTATKAQSAHQQVAQVDTDEISATAERAQAVRDDLTKQVETMCEAIADAWATVTDERYGTLRLSIDDSKWELKHDGGDPSYLRRGGRGGTYVYGDYDPSLVTLIKYSDEIVEFASLARSVINDKAERGAELDYHKALMEEGQ